MSLNLKRLFLRTLGRIIPSDVFSYRYPVSIKGVCFIDDKVVLLKNERREWDLPGGKLERKEEITDCLAREFQEELNIAVQVRDLLHVTLINVMNTIDVLVVIYHCSTQASLSDLRISHENFDVNLFTVEELNDIELPDNYRKTVRKAFKTRRLKTDR